MGFLPGAIILTVCFVRGEGEEYTASKWIFLNFFANVFACDFPLLFNNFPHLPCIQFSAFHLVRPCLTRYIVVFIFVWLK